MTSLNGFKLSVSTDLPSLMPIAQTLARKLMLPLVEINAEHYQLVITQQHLELRSPGISPICIDFLTGKNAHRRKFGGGRGQALAKAVSLKKSATPSIIDATAGYGRDAFVLASLGCKVTLIERNPLLASLLDDALKRAGDDPEISIISKRMTLINCDASHYLSQLKLQQRPDIVYIDPMYPSRSKSALVKKEMQLLHQMVGPDNDSEQLLTIARDTALKRVVVKRPKSAKPILGSRPSSAVESKNTRYDIYLPTPGNS